MAESKFPPNGNYMLGPEFLPWHLVGQTVNQSETGENYKQGFSEISKWNKDTVQKKCTEMHVYSFENVCLTDTQEKYLATFFKNLAAKLPKSV